VICPGAAPDLAAAAAPYARCAPCFLHASAAEVVTRQLRFFAFISPFRPAGAQAHAKQTPSSYDGRENSRKRQRRNTFEFAEHFAPRSTTSMNIRMLLLLMKEECSSGFEAI